MENWAKIMAFSAPKLLRNGLEIFLTRYKSGSTKQILSSKRKPNIDIRHIIPHDIPKILHLFDTSFAECEPLVNLLKVPKLSYNSELKEFFKNSIDHGTTFIAGVSSNFIGLINNTKLTPWEPEWYQLSKNIKCTKTKELINLLSFAIKDSKILKKNRSCNIFNINHILVDNDLINKLNINKLYLSTLLIDKSFKMAPLVGCKLASIVCTDNNTKQIAENLNMKLIYDNPCSNLIDENYQPIIKNINTICQIKIYTKNFD